ncbi:MAG: hypothetical protein HY755_10725 [Nitrospirae bacterium]|nr:hypothetical protein [Nitrospirota bacterium]
MRKESADRRQHKRQMSSEPADFTVVGNIAECRECLAEPEQKGNVVATSDKGLRLLTAYPLKPGNLIKFNNIEDPSVGIVMWTVTTENTCKAEVFLMEFPFGESELRE